MSVYQFLSSDKPFKNIDNTQAEFLSIEEAEGRNISMPDWYSKDIDVSRTKKILLYAPNEECLREIQIQDDNDSYYAKQYSSKSYHASLQWGYSDVRATQLIEYIREHLANCPEIEIWSIWLDREAKPTIKEHTMASLTISDIEKFEKCNPYEKPYCLVVRK